jgi:hypothetical protein
MSQDQSGTSRTEPIALVDRLGAWPVRAVWLLLPLLGGSIIVGDALADASRPVQLVSALGLWSGWVAVLVATLVPSTVSLTVVRIGAPAGCLAVVTAAVASDDSAAGWRVAAVTGALVTLGVVLFPSTGEVFVDGSSYGAERRFPLRIPAPLLLGPLELAWLAVVAGLAAGPLLLAAKQWVVGVPAVIAGAAAVWWGVRVLHNLARRWIVLVPGGVVLHDPLALTDPVLLRRGNLLEIVPAPADSDAVDLTRGALGLALEARLAEPVPLTIRAARPGGPVETVEADRLLFTPTRPGALLRGLRSPLPTRGR